MDSKLRPTATENRLSTSKVAIQLRRTHQELSDGMLVELSDSRRASHGQVGCLEKYESVQSVPFPSPRAEISEIRPHSGPTVLCFYFLRLNFHRDGEVRLI